MGEAAKTICLIVAGIAVFSGCVLGLANIDIAVNKTKSEAVSKVGAHNSEWRHVTNMKVVGKDKIQGILNNPRVVYFQRDGARYGLLLTDRDKWSAITEGGVYDLDYSVKTMEIGTLVLSDER